VTPHRRAGADEVTVRFEDRWGDPLDGSLLREALEKEGLTVEYRGPTLFFHDPVTMPSEVITIVVGSTAILKVVNAGIRRWKARRVDKKQPPPNATVRVILGPKEEVLSEITVTDDSA
jgi:hypothetical protein